MEKRPVSETDGVTSTHNKQLLLMRPAEETVTTCSGAPRFRFKLNGGKTAKRKSGFNFSPRPVASAACDPTVGESPWRTERAEPAGATPRRSHSGNSWLSLGLGFRPGLPGLIEPWPMVVDAASHGNHRSRGSKADIRPWYRPSSLPSPPRSFPFLPHGLSSVSASLSGPCHSRITALGPAFRVLEYYRARHEAAPRHPPLSSHPPSPLLTSLATVASPVHLRLLHAGCLPARSRQELSRPSYRGSFKTTHTPNYRILRFSIPSSSPPLPLFRSLRLKSFCIRFFRVSANVNFLYRNPLCFRMILSTIIVELSYKV